MAKSKTLRSIPPIGRLGPNSLAGAVPHAPPPQAVSGRPFPDVGRPEVAPRGPSLLHLGQKRNKGTGGPGEPPIAWEGPATEWVWHWCSRKLYFRQEGLDPYELPWGGLTWAYQVPENPANPREASGSVSDFVYQVSGNNVLVRIEGFYDHVQRGGAAQKARDLYLVTHAGVAGDRVVRVQDAEFMEDETGSTGIKLLADILGNRTHVGGLAGGLVQAPRYASFVALSQ